MEFVFFLFFFFQAEDGIRDKLVTGVQTCALPISFWRSSRSNPVITEITRINTVTPSITPRMEISVMIERNVRFGFRYRSARKRLNGSFNSLLAWRQTHWDSTACALAYFNACAFSSSSVANSSAEACVASRSTGAARL